MLGETGKVEGCWKSSAKEKLPGIYKGDPNEDTS